jgi:hypothetical protein
MNENERAQALSILSLSSSLSLQLSVSLARAPFRSPDGPPANIVVRLERKQGFQWRL